MGVRAAPTGAEPQARRHRCWNAARAAGSRARRAPSAPAIAFRRAVKVEQEEPHMVFAQRGYVGAFCRQLEVGQEGLECAIGRRVGRERARRLGPQFGGE